MSMQTQGVGVCYVPSLHGSRGQTSVTIDAAGEKIAMCFTVLKPGNITTVAFRTSTVTTAESLKISLQALDSSGDPDGTILGSTNNGFATVAVPASNTGYSITLGESVTVSEGDRISLVIEFTSTVGIVAISQVNQGIGADGGKSNYLDQYATASWGKSDRLLMMGIGYDGVYSFHPGMTPLTSGTNRTWNSTSTQVERGIKFRLAAAIYARGFWMYSDVDGDYNVNLYLGDSHTPLRSFTTGVGTHRDTTSIDLINGFFAGVKIEPDTWYRLTLEAKSSGSNVSLPEWGFRSDLEGMLPLGAGNMMACQWDTSGTPQWLDGSTYAYSIGLLAFGYYNNQGAGKASYQLGI